MDNDPNYPKGYYYGDFEELQGCITDGDTIEEFMAELEVVKHMWLEIKLDRGDEIPEPKR